MTEMMNIVKLPPPDPKDPGTFHFVTRVVSVPEAAYKSDWIELTAVDDFSSIPLVEFDDGNTTDTSHVSPVQSPSPAPVSVPTATQSPAPTTAPTATQSPAPTPASTVNLTTNLTLRFWDNH